MSRVVTALSDRFFALLHRYAASPTAYFNLPTDSAVTLGTQVDLYRLWRWKAASYWAP